MYNSPDVVDHDLWLIVSSSPNVDSPMLPELKGLLGGSTTFDVKIGGWEFKFRHRQSIQALKFQMSRARRS
jgi:hypothetical protein